MSRAGLHQRTLWIAILGAALFTAAIFISRHASDRRWRFRGTPPDPALAAEFQHIYGGKGLNIIQFYARDGVIAEGGRTLICYGVVNARSVAIEPPLGDLAPSISRCLDAAPERDTRYTLTAVGLDGSTSTASLEVRVAPDPDTLPRIDYFRIDRRQHDDSTGRMLFTLAYADRNGEEISIDPPVFPTLHRAPYGRFYVAPLHTTTYTLKVKNKFGHVAERRLTVEVPEP